MSILPECEIKAQTKPAIAYKTSLEETINKDRNQFIIIIIITHHHHPLHQTCPSWSSNLSISFNPKLILISQCYTNNGAYKIISLPCKQNLLSTKAQCILLTSLNLFLQLFKCCFIIFMDHFLGAMRMNSQAVISLFSCLIDYT